MKQIPAPLLTLVAGVIVTLVSLWVGQNHGLMPEQASEQAPLVDGLFNVMVTISVALFLVVEGTILYFAIRFRRPEGDDTDGIPLEGNLPLEAFWTAIPAIIVIGLGVYSVDIFQRMGGTNPGDHSAMAHHHAAAVVAQAPNVAGDVSPLLAEAPATRIPTYGIGAPVDQANQIADLVVNVTGMQYAWIFNYPNSGITTGELHVPVGKSVKLNLTAQDVIHSFWVPQFRMKQDVIPGEANEYRFTATKAGTYPIVCTELCGSYHGGMRAELIAQTPEEFSQWLQANQVAQTPEAEHTVATRPADLSQSEFLAPYAREMGVDANALAQVHAAH